MDTLLKHYSESFYTSPISFLIAIVGLILCITHKPKHKPLRRIPLYFLSHVITYMTFIIHGVFFIQSPLHNIFLLVNAISDYLLTIIEFYIFISVIECSIQHRVHIIKALKKMFGLLAITLAVNDFFLFTELKQSSLYILFTAQAIGLIVASFFYYVYLFRLPPISDLKNQPTFWIITGISFFMICTLPYSIAINYLQESNPFITKYLFSIFYVFYCLLFLMIIKALLCNSAICK
jgi:hypothetical protein